MVRPVAFPALIDASTLAAHVADAVFAVIDCRYNLNDEGWGAAQVHPGTHTWCCVHQASAATCRRARTGRNGRHPLPDPATLMATFGRLGVADGVQVVAYDQDNNIYASRLWWMLRWLGHNDVAVLDGGLAKWLTKNRPLRSGVETRRLVTSAASRGPAG